MYQLTIEPLGTTIEVEDNQTLLDAALRQGIYLPHACGHGMCGSCKVDVADGEVDHGAANPFALMDVEREEGKTLACCATLLSDATIEADIEEDPDAESIPVEDFSGVVQESTDLTPTIKRLRLKLDRPMQFQAGQYVQLTIPGLEGTRAFSIANPPQEVNDTAVIELHVRRVPGGQGTAWLHDELKTGDEVQLSGPYGRFFVRKSADMPMIFMAGGSGLSSPRSMILDLLAEGCQQSITLVYGQRSLEELYDHDEFLALAEAHPNFTYVPALSDEPAESGWQGLRGFVHEAASAHFTNGFAGHKAYLCGPPPMIEAGIGALMQGRLFERDIYTERFLSAADAQQARSPLFKRV
ncbi:phenol 2-monooxygenase domain-containing protein [Hydrogenophaga sp. 5NK40-0174]|uniref:NADH:ubiquinone reductase (Na(+)-transporting) subunit F n=1 Tax=Hydrogenophaga sp. 5NK40-0174 TaxID=3127649 RepID=UPI0031029036